MRLIATALALSLTLPVAAEPVRRDHLTVELVAEHTSAAPGAETMIGLRLAHDPHWHTYWVNPGDSGLATRIDVEAPPGSSVGPIEWPAPARIPAGPLINFGFEGEIVLPMRLTIPADAEPGSALPIRAKASWLVCEVECIPGDAELTLALPIAADGAAPGPHAPLFAEARRRAPREAPEIEARYSVEGDALVLTVSPGAVELDAATLELFAIAPQLFATTRGTVDTDGAAMVIRTPLSDAFAGLPKMTRVVLAHRSGDAREAFVVDAIAEGALRRDGDPGEAGAVGIGPTASTPDTGLPASFALAAVLAFFGGLLLNLMPCVFPVLALKALALSEAGLDRAAARRDAVAYLLGVVLSFLALAGVLLALKAGGEALGWGFQLQSPPVVAALALVMLLVGLSLSGLWSLGGRWTGAGESLARRGGATGAFFTGVLAVVVASPCTAPLMGPALGYAATQPPAVALSVFAILGLGLALPLAALGFVPALAARLPRPGPWMESLRQFLAFPMYGAAIWLGWVLGLQAGVDALARLLLAGLFLALALWLLGRAPLRPLPRALRALAMLLSIVAAVAVLAPLRAPAPGPQEVADHDFSPSRLEDLRAQDRPVFVNMTAAWCITCLANERVALSTDTVQQALKDHDVAYLEGDWTNRDPVITAYLAQFGRNGVPIYVVYPRGGGTPRVLPQILTPGLVADALAWAAKPDSKLASDEGVPR